MGQVGDLLLRDVRPWPREPGASSVDVLIRDGRIASGEAPADVPVAEGGVECCCRRSPMPTLTSTRRASAYRSAPTPPSRGSPG